MQVPPGPSQVHGPTHHPSTKQSQQSKSPWHAQCAPEHAYSVFVGRFCCATIRGSAEP
ncbi:hypothetical protein [Amycolatopsis acidicola]|uniref:hypothetical protein n=1 Tax=Amycolatopsis acidicola TaxID=2596893 RepID=UPI00140D6F97|nr:hypothetical protein [Amycolatopsis acidicola]